MYAFDVGMRRATSLKKQIEEVALVPRTRIICNG